jgi:hypothetical protein
MAKKFRKYIGRFEYWHFQASCPDWPQGNYIGRARISARARVCPKCLYLAEKQANKQCTNEANHAPRLLLA